MNALLILLFVGFLDMKQASYKGISAYAMLHKDFPIKRFIKAFPAKTKTNLAVAIVANRFGNNWANVKLWIASQGDNKHAVEVHFMSGPARRNRNADKFDLWPHLSVDELNRKLENGILFFVEREIVKLREQLEKVVNDKTDVFISPELEDNLSDKAFKRFLLLFKRGFNGSTIKPRWVRSPCTHGDYVPPRVLSETHGEGKLLDADIYNPDGISVNFQDGETYFDTMSVNQLRSQFDKFHRARIRFIWSAHMQGVGQSASFNYPPVNKRRYLVTDNAIDICNELLS
jgi:hypothetical protein